jgi:hypothetical protein
MLTIWQRECIFSRQEDEMKTKLLALMLFAGSSMFAGTHISIGFGVGGYYPPPPPPRVVAYVPRSPGFGYVWVPGYWYPRGHRYEWRAGFWSRPPYRNAYWVAPRYEGRRYMNGYWRR